MCGIAGFSGNFSSSLLQRMNNVIAHRGPDAEGILYVHEKQVGLAHRRLAIIDLSSAGKQPMWDSSHSVVIVFNGEIYNYKDLADELMQEGFHFNTKTDTEVILNLYLRDGEKCLDRLNGIFAFALWDKRTETLLIARDSVGVKPLYYATTPDGFLFASEIKALLQDKRLDRSLDPIAIHHYLTYLWSPAPRTILKQVKKLEPGHALIVQKGGIRKQWQFYDLPYSQNITELSVEEAICQVQDNLKQAIQRQMVADVPIGAFLSGGLDSSAVVAFAKQILSAKQKLQCFTIGFKDNTLQQEGMIDDLPYAKEVAEYLNVDLHTIYVGPEMTDHLEKMIYHLDEPQADPASLNVFFISELAREHDIKVLLSGTGGDDIFTGYRRHYALLLEKYWSWMPHKCRGMMAVFCSKISKQIAAGRRLAKAFQYANLDGHERIASYFFWARQETLLQLYHQDFFGEIRAGDYQEPLAKTLTKLPPNTHPLNKMLYLEGKHFLADHNLNYTDKMSMAVGVEVRVPLLDPDLVSLAARLPVKYKQRGQIGKWIFKKAMEPYLPYNVIYRPKTGFGAPLRRWLHHELKPLMNDILSEEAIRKRGIFDWAGVSWLMQQDKSGRLDGTYTIFSLMCIEIWCRIFLDELTSSFSSQIR